MNSRNAFRNNFVTKRVVLQINQNGKITENFEKPSKLSKFSKRTLTKNMDYSKSSTEKHEVNKWSKPKEGDK